MTHHFLNPSSFLSWCTYPAHWGGASVVYIAGAPYNVHYVVSLRRCSSSAGRLIGAVFCTFRAGGPGLQARYACAATLLCPRMCAMMPQFYCACTRVIHSFYMRRLRVLSWLRHDISSATAHARAFVIPFIRAVSGKEHTAAAAQILGGYYNTYVHLNNREVKQHGYLPVCHYVIEGRVEKIILLTSLFSSILPSICTYTGTLPGLEEYMDPFVFCCAYSDGWPFGWHSLSDVLILVGVLDLSRLRSILGA